ncbi:MAG: aspartate/glutamate racemase family protein [Desulfobacterales bacterium]
MTILKGGANIYGIPIGVLSLESYFAKPPGHVKNAGTFGFPVTFKVVKGATTKKLVDHADRSLLEPFIAAAQELESEGVEAITGSCGFLVLFQREIADAVNIPVFLSSLIQVPMVYRMLKQNQKVGILTAKKDSLTQQHLRAVGAEDIPVCIAGMDDQEEFCDVIIDYKRIALDFGKLEKELLSVAKGLVGQHPDIGAIVLECTDMSYFAPLIQQTVKLPVFDIITLTNMVYQAVVRRPFVGMVDTNA